MDGTPTESAQKPLELILARNLLTSINTPAFLVDAGGHMLYYNDAAGALLGVSFEDSGGMNPAEWTAKFGPFNSDGQPLGLEQLELTNALRSGRPAHHEFMIRSSDAREHQIAASALPIAGSGATSGAIVIFWPLDETEAKRVGASAGKTAREAETGEHKAATGSPDSSEAGA